MLSKETETFLCSVHCRYFLCWIFIYAFGRLYAFVRQSSLRQSSLHKCYVLRLGNGHQPACSDDAIVCTMTPRPPFYLWDTC